jgi:high-affinity Fe2+/Pb2+ permease
VCRLTVLLADVCAVVSGIGRIEQVTTVLLLLAACMLLAISGKKPDANSTSQTGLLRPGAAFAVCSALLGRALLWVTYLDG